MTRNLCANGANSIPRYFFASGTSDAEQRYRGTLLNYDCRWPDNDNPQLPRGGKRGSSKVYTFSFIEAVRDFYFYSGQLRNHYLNILLRLRRNQVPYIDAGYASGAAFSGVPPPANLDDWILRLTTMNPRLWEALRDASGGTSAGSALKYSYRLDDPENPELGQALGVIAQENLPGAGFAPMNSRLLVEFLRDFCVGCALRR